MEHYDACVIGAGGVVGSAIIRELALRGGRIIGFESHTAPAVETSGRNSRVLHSGFHEQEGTLKAQLTAAGCRRAVEYCNAAGVPLLRTGMLIALPRNALSCGLWREAGQLWNLWHGGRRQQIPFRWILPGRGIRQIAPIRALGGIFIPSICVVDVLRFIQSMQKEAVQRGAVILYGNEVQAIETTRDGFSVHAKGGAVNARVLINSAGLHACNVSRMAGGPDFNVEYVRGEYYELRGGIARWKIRTLIYPAMPRNSRSKGIHFGPRTDGRLYIGPDASTAPSPTPKSVFVKAAQRFVPEIQATDLDWAYSGTRPKYTRPDGVSDFLIRAERKSPLLINLIGIDSPGLSASMGIAAYVSNLIPWADEGKGRAGEPALFRPSAARDGMPGAHIFL